MWLCSQDWRICCLKLLVLRSLFTVLRREDSKITKNDFNTRKLYSYCAMEDNELQIRIYCKNYLKRTIGCYTTESLNKIFNDPKRYYVANRFQKHFDQLFLNSEDLGLSFLRGFFIQPRKYIKTSNDWLHSASPLFAIRPFIKKNNIWNISENKV